ncbi:hypothetical protein RD792_002328 [Penstemon davidsonii]|uniref:Protein TIFY n=1 Tax=Penstemon davidsonii TaxID=160366 RepID=A0ABR0DRT5_9LAMI|nr:hypothetical protein RD792_002328 [Penstemon davidsonii]
MKRNCNLELRLVTPSVFSHSSNYINNIGQCNSMLDLFGESPNEKKQPQPQPLTIFYNGRVAVSDVTELQARSIIMLAKSTSPNDHDPHSQLHSPISGLSMKRSLQKFLEKRKTRAEATSPYPRHPN